MKRTVICPHCHQSMVITFNANEAHIQYITKVCPKCHEESEYRVTVVVVHKELI